MASGEKQISRLCPEIGLSHSLRRDSIHARTGYQHNTMVEVVIVGAEIWLIEDLFFTCCDSSSGVRLAAKFRLGPRKVWHSSFRESGIGPMVSLLKVMPTLLRTVFA